MLSNVRKLFKFKGPSSPSSKDRPSPFNTSTEHPGSRGRGLSQDSLSGSRGRSGKDVSANGDLGPFCLSEHSSSNGHCENGHLPASPPASGFDVTYLSMNKSGPSSPAHPHFKKSNEKPVTDPKVLQIFGATEDDEGFIKNWIVQSSPKAGGSSEFSLPQNGDSDESDSSPDIAEGSSPQKSELPPSFEFARPTGTGKPLYEDQVIPSPHSRKSSSQNRPELDLPRSFPFGNANRSYGEESSMENGTATASGEDSSVDSLDALAKATRSPIRAQYLSRPSSPRPSNGYSSPHAPSSPRGSSHSPDGRSWGSNGTRLEGMSWGSTGSASPKWPYNGQLSPDRGNRILHPLPAPPSTPFGQPQFYGPPNVNPGWGPGWTELSNPGATRDWQGQTSVHRVQSPSHHRVSPRMTSYLSPVVSPLPSPPRSPLRAAQPSFPPGSWAPLPTPPIPSHSPHLSPPRSPSRSPRKLTRWKEIKQIGTGSFGTVHEAINLDDGSFFAVKVSRDESIPAEIQKEIEVLSMLRHPNVVQYFGTAMKDGHLCIFLELMQNSLQSIIKVFHHFDETLISTYTRQILQGLEYLHRKNTIHRDIKCANILVDKDGQVKLADFGLAKEVGMSPATSCKGTPYFMAPEILKPHSKKNRGYGLPVDIWSLGCTVLEMADGEPPWSFLGGFSFFFKLNKGELPPIPEHLSLSCKDFIRSCLQFRPEDRPTASQLLLHPFVANAPATAEAAAFVSPSPAAMFMRSSLIEGLDGRNGELHQSNNGIVSSDGQGQDLQHHRPTLQRSRRLDRSLNGTYANSHTDPQQSQENVPFSPRSPSLELPQTHQRKSVAKEKTVPQSLSRPRGHFTTVDGIMDSRTRIVYGVMRNCHKIQV